MRPWERAARSDHRATEIADARRGAPRCGPVSLARSFRMASERRAANEDMTRRRDAFCTAQEMDQFVPGFFPARARTGLVGSAAFVDLTCRYARESNAWPLGAPDRTIPIPYADGRAGECGSGRDDLSEQQKDHDSAFIWADSASGQRLAWPRMLTLVIGSIRTARSLLARATASIGTRWRDRERGPCRACRISRTGGHCRT